MITPEIFLNLDNSILNFSCSILEIYSKKEAKIIKYNELYLELKKSFNGDKVDLMYIPTLDFLFLLGKLEYSEEKDELELII